MTEKSVVSCSSKRACLRPGLRAFFPREAYNGEN